MLSVGFMGYLIPAKQAVIQICRKKAAAGEQEVLLCPARPCLAGELYTPSVDGISAIVLFAGASHQGSFWAEKHR